MYFFGVGFVPIIKAENSFLNCLISPFISPIGRFTVFVFSLNEVLNENPISISVAFYENFDSISGNLFKYREKI